MKIENSPLKTQNIQFKTNAYVKQITKPITNSKVGKNLTLLDINCFQTYILARKFSFITEEKEIQELFQFQGKNFLAKAFEFLVTKLNIRSDLTPVLDLAPPKDPVQFAYLPQNNIILTPHNIENFNNIQIFTLLRHELQHYQQNMLMRRDDEIGEKLPTKYADKIIEIMQNNALENLVNSSFEELSEKNNLTPEQKEFYKICDYFIKKDDIEGFFAVFEPLKEIYKNEWIKVRNALLKEYGPLTPKEKEKAQAYYDDFFNIDYYNEDGSINTAKHITTGIEYEANIAAEYTTHQLFNKDCFFKTIKDTSLKFINSENKDVQKLLSETVEDVRQKLK